MTPTSRPAGQTVEEARETVVEGLRDGGYCLSAEDIAERFENAVRARTLDEVQALAERFAAGEDDKFWAALAALREGR